MIQAESSTFPKIISKVSIKAEHLIKILQGAQPEFYPAFNKTHIAVIGQERKQSLIHFNQNGDILGRLQIENGLSQCQIGMIDESHVIVFGCTQTMQQKTKLQSRKERIFYIWNLSNYKVKMLNYKAVKVQVTSFQLLTFNKSKIFCIVQVIFNEHSPMLGYMWYQPLEVWLNYFGINEGEQQIQYQQIFASVQSLSYQEIKFRNFQIMKVDEYSSIAFVNKSSTMLPKDHIRIVNLQNNQKSEFYLDQIQLQLNEVPRSKMGYAGLVDIWQPNQDLPYVYMKFNSTNSTPCIQFSCIWDYINDTLVYSELKQDQIFHEQFPNSLRVLGRMNETWTTRWTTTQPNQSIHFLQIVDDTFKTVGKYPTISNQLNQNV